MWAKYNTSTRAIQRLKVLLNNIDNAIDSLIKPTAAADHEAAEDEYDRWKRSEPRAEKGTEHVNNPIKY
jgi:hypothetical protein